MPKHAHGTVNFERHTSSSKQIINAVTDLYSRIANRRLLVRRLTITANHLLSETDADAAAPPQQLSVFEDTQTALQRSGDDAAALRREKRMQQAMITIKRRFGKNSIVKGMSFEEGATAMDRNGQIGGHKA